MAGINEFRNAVALQTQAMSVTLQPDEPRAAKAGPLWLPISIQQLWRKIYLGAYSTGWETGEILRKGQRRDQCSQERKL